MGESRRSRGQLLVVAAVGYGAVFVALCLLAIPSIAVAVYFVIPTAMVAIAGGPAAGLAGAGLSMLLVQLGAGVNPGAAEPTEPSLALARLIALVITGLLIGWFASRNRQLVAELRIRAELDNLTGIGNHRFYEAAVDRRLQAGRPFALVLCDMDRLKDVNDGHGHSAGDEALRALAVNLRKIARSDDEVARIGGDEFCLVATCRTDEEANALASRVEAALAEAGCPATLGWAIHPADARSKTELFKVADKRLYERKAARTPVLRALPSAI